MNKTMETKVEPTTQGLGWIRAKARIETGFGKKP